MADSENRLAHEQTTREADERDNEWQPAQLLPEPVKLPGYAYRWNRIATLNVADERNISSKMREGWEPVAPEEQPQMVMLVDAKTKLPNSIEIGGLVLCKIPEEKMLQREKYFAGKTNAQMEAVDNSLMRQNDPKSNMKIFKEGRSTVSRSFGTGE